MDFDKKTIIAFLLIGLILILTQTDLFKKWAYSDLEKGKREAVTQPKEEDGLEQKSTAPGAPEEQQMMEKQREQTAQKVTNEARSDSVGMEKFAYLAGPGRTVTVETDLFEAELSTQGATLRRWMLKDYLAADSSEVQLVGGNGYGDFALLVPLQDDTLDTSPLVFSVNKDKVVITASNPTDQLIFTLDLGNGRQIEKTYTFNYDRYSMELSVDFKRMDQSLEGYSYYLIWRSGVNSTEPDFKDDMNHARVYALQGSDLQKFDVGNTFHAKDWDNPTEWIAIKTKYFASIAVPENVEAQGVSEIHAKAVPTGQSVPWKKYGYNLQMPLYRDKSNSGDRFILYLGPLSYDRLKSYGVGLEQILDFGWSVFRPLAKFILWSFKGLHNVIPNYGVVIILFSIMIKLVLYPLTRKSYQSMKEMQALQPLMKDINEKYKDDPQKKQEALMKLYREHGVNPLGGCIPMVLQMPLLISLFNVFRSTIQLRGASFVWWIKDLSRPDTIATIPTILPFNNLMYGNSVNILPLFMGVTMFIQQKISVKDPKQKAMVYFMPIFLTLLFNSFPSGLNLYYALFNLLTILQEKLIPYHPKDPAETKKQTKAPARRKVTKLDKWRRLKSS